VVNFTVVASVEDTNNLKLQGVSDLEYARIAGDDFLFVASEADSAVTSFQVSQNSAPALRDTIEFSASSGTFAVTQVSVTTVGGEVTLLPMGRLDDDVAIYHIDNAGVFSNAIPQSANGNDIGRFHVSQNLTIDGKVFLFVSEWGVQGISSYRMKPDDTLNTKNSYENNVFDYVDDISAFTTVDIAGKNFLFAASSFDAGLSSFRVGRHGNLHLKDTVAPSDGSGFHLPQALETIAVDGQNYVLMGSAGTDSITVYSVAKNGGLTEVDHLLDSLDTRFEDVSVLESFNYNDRAFVLAAGSDDGITLLELHSGGVLSVISVLADDFDTTLNNVTDIEVVEFGAEVHAFVSSGSENGFTQIEIDLGDLNVSRIGKTAPDTLTGTAGDDVLSGMGGRDTLHGGDGDDRLVDGKGKDHLFGGAGADIFQFVEDGKKDIIHDYEAGIDLIDLSQIAAASHISSLSIKSREFGAAIFVGEEEIRVETDNGLSLTAADFTVDDFIF
jgi:Ca2+-binding RTX toxin-like protein